VKDSRGQASAVALALATLALVLFTGLLIPGAATAGASASVAAHQPAGCAAASHVLLLGSYPSEVAMNLDREVLDPDQPTVIDGLDFYAGTLGGARVIIAIAGPSPAVTYATTVLALQNFSCTSAVVFSGTAGGGGASGLGDVTVPAAWTANNGASFTPVSSVALAVARQIAASATRQLGTSAPVNDGPCLCQGVAESLKAVPILRTPRVIVGGYGTTYGGDSDFCFAQGGMLEGCNPCPPSSGASVATVTVATGGLSSSDVALNASLEAKGGTLVAGAQLLLSNESAPPPTAAAETAGAPTYIADDQQTTGAQQAADAYHVPFIAFRGISDTSAVGNLWPFEWLVYQQLAADNSATAARLWIQRWSER
jgi:nucleoside phosphorylase